METRVPGGESGVEFFKRFDAALLTIEEMGLETVAIVSHKAAITAWTLFRAQNIAPSFGKDADLGNAQGVIVEGSNSSGWQLVSWAGNSKLASKN